MIVNSGYGDFGDDTTTPVANALTPAQVKAKAAADAKAAVAAENQAEAARQASASAMAKLTNKTDIPSAIIKNRAVFSPYFKQTWSKWTPDAKQAWDNWAALISKRDGAFAVYWGDFIKYFPLSINSWSPIARNQFTGEVSAINAANQAKTKSIGTQISQAASGVVSAVITASTPQTVLNPFTKLKADLGVVSSVFSAADVTVQATNPLNKQLNDLNMAGREAGGVARVLGNVGNIALKKPVETTLAVTGIMAITSALSAGASSLTSTAAEGTATAASETGAFTSVTGTSVESILGTAAPVNITASSNITAAAAAGSAATGASTLDVIGQAAKSGYKYVGTGSAALKTIQSIAGKQTTTPVKSVAPIGQAQVQTGQAESNIIPIVVIGILAKLIFF